MRYVSLEDLRKAITEGRRKGKEQGLAYFIEEILGSPSLLAEVGGNAFKALELGSYSLDVELDYVDMSSIRWGELKVEQQIQLAKHYQQWYAQQVNQTVEETIEGIAMCLIPPGKYIQNKELVGIEKAFWCGKYPVTQQQWKAVMESNPSHFKGKDLPVERVDWFECKEFCKKTGFQLLSGADWEYACRGATTTEFCFGNEEKELKKYAWYVENSRFKTHQVGGKKPNGFGLYDMHGNVWEWCEDFYPYLFSSRICCGGCWNESAKYCRSAFREGSYPSDRNMALGVRVCRSV